MLLLVELWAAGRELLVEKDAEDEEELLELLPDPQ